VKREESRLLCVSCFLGEKYGGKREKKCPKQLPKTQIFSSSPILGAMGYF